MLYCGLPLWNVYYVFLPYILSTIDWYELTPQNSVFWHEPVNFWEDDNDTIAKGYVHWKLWSISFNANHNDIVYVQPSSILGCMFILFCFVSHWDILELLLLFICLWLYKLNNCFHVFLEIYRFLLYYLQSYNSSDAHVGYVVIGVACLLVGLIAFGMSWDELGRNLIVVFLALYLEAEIYFLYRKNLPWYA